MASQKASIPRGVAPLRSLPRGLLHAWSDSPRHAEPRSRTLLSRSISFEQISALISPCRFANKYFLFTIFFNPLKTMP